MGKHLTLEAGFLQWGGDTYLLPETAMTAAITWGSFQNILKFEKENLYTCRKIVGCQEAIVKEGMDQTPGSSL